MLHLVWIGINQKSFKTKLKCICWVVPIITMRAQDLPAYVKSKKSTMALWMTLLRDSNGKETWNLAIHHSPVTPVHVAGLAVLESSLQWSQLHVAREKLLESWLGYSHYIHLQHSLCTPDPHLRFALGFVGCLLGKRCAECVCGGVASFLWYRQHLK